MDTGVFHFDITKIDSSTRMIEGRATMPVVDHEKEIILKSAIEHALPYFMELPVMTYNHSERPVGLWHEAHIGDDGGLYVKGKVKSSPDADDIWELIEKGMINSLSITGRRLEGSPSCRLKSHSRTEPCQTTKAYMYAITLCGDARVNINPAAYVNIAKAISEGVNPFGEELEEDRMTEHTTPEEQKEQIGSPVIEKGFDTAPLLEAIGKLSEKFDELTKAREETPVKDPVVEEQTGDYIEKAAFEDALSTITKSLETIEKKFGEIEERLDRVEENPIQKAAVIIGGDGTDMTATSNVDAINRVINGA